MKQNYINHIAFVIDKSGSMNHLREDLHKVFTNQIKFLAKRSQELDQETRVSVYLFDDSIECQVYDKDVMRLPTVDKNWGGGGTGLIDATLKAIEDLKQTPELYGEHSFLIYVLTDGQNTNNGHLRTMLAKNINSLADNWTLGVLVPDQSGVHEAKQFGFPTSNIQVWTTTSRGLQAAGDVIQKSTERFFQGRVSGIRGTKSLFTVDTSNISTSKVKSNLTQLKASEYMLVNVNKDAAIAPFVESWTTDAYVKGQAYYMLTKSETIQHHKQVCIQHRLNGKVYGGLAARQLLGLPDYDIKVKPENYGDYDIFVQSTSSNRKLIAGTKLIILL